jgi:hypothetical protein
MNAMIDRTRRGLERNAMQFPRRNGPLSGGGSAESLRDNSNVTGGWALALPRRSPAPRVKGET